MYIPGIAINFWEKPEWYAHWKCSFFARRFDTKTKKLPGKCGFQKATSHTIYHIVFIPLHKSVTIPQKTLHEIRLFERNTDTAIRNEIKKCFVSSMPATRCFSSDVPHIRNVIKSFFP